MSIIFRTSFSTKMFYFHEFLLHYLTYFYLLQCNIKFKSLFWNGTPKWTYTLVSNQEELFYFSEKMSDRPTILVTGAGGYIGSHCIIVLLEQNYNVIGIDNFVNSVKGAQSKYLIIHYQKCSNFTKFSEMPKSLAKVCELTGKPIKFYEVDICDKNGLRRVFSQNKIDCVIHIAALKSVGESCKSPIKYFSVNVAGSINLIEIMEEFSVKRIVFSSSSTVFGEPDYLPIDEEHPTGKCINPYGRTKYIFEEFLKDICKAHSDWNVMSLRYFNPVGAHPSGIIGEDPLGVPYNLVPFIAQVSH